MKKMKDITAKVTQYFKNTKHTGTWTNVDLFIWVVATDPEGLHAEGFFAKDLDGSVRLFNFPTKRMTHQELDELLEFVEEFTEANEPTDTW